MGNWLTTIYNRFNQKTPVRLLLLGLDAAGKTTILYKLKLNETVNTIPTIGFNVEQLTYKNLEFTCWDVGGQDRLRTLWPHYFDNTQGLIFVVDSSDRSRIQEAAETFHNLAASDELKDASILIYANKQDLPNAMTVPELTEELGLMKLDHKRKWQIQASNAKRGDGLIEGMDWMSYNFTKLKA